MAQSFCSGTAAVNSLFACNAKAVAGSGLQCTTWLRTGNEGVGVGLGVRV